MFKPKLYKGFNALLLFPFLIFLAFSFVSPSIALALTQRLGMSKADAQEYLNAQIGVGYFPIEIQTYFHQVAPGVLNGPYWKVRVVPFPTTTNFDFRYIINAPEDAYNNAKTYYGDYTLIYDQFCAGYGYNAIWVKNEVVVRKFESATVFEVPYSVTSWDLAKRLPGHLIKYGLGEAIEILVKLIFGTGFGVLSYIDTAFTIFFELIDANDPVRVIPLTPIVERDEWEYLGRGACAGRKISGMILLDLVREGTADVDPAKLNDLSLSSEYYISGNVRLKDQMIVLLKDEIRTLPKERSYYIVPKISLKAPSKSDPGFIQTDNFFRLAAITKEDWHLVSYASYPHVYFGKCPVNMGPIVILLHDDVQRDQIIFFDNFNSENNGVGAINYNSFANWNVTSGSVDLTGNGADWFSVDLDGSTYQNGTLTSKQNFTFESGKSYTLSFSLAPSPNISSSTVYVKVASGTLLNEVITLSRQIPFGFADYSYTFFGNGTSGHLSFTDGGSGINTGMHLDNVKLAEHVNENETLGDRN